MACKVGYDPDSPLCAVCSSGYFLQLRSCERCDEPRVGALVGAVAAAAVAAAAAAYASRRYGHYFRGLLVHVKILASFFAVVATIDTQFGVAWPPVFLSALAVLSAVTLDLGTLYG